MVAPVNDAEASPGVWITLDQAQLLRDMCVNATAQEAKVKIRIGEAQMALEEQINALAPQPTANRQSRRAEERNRGRSRANANGSSPSPAPAGGSP